MSRGLGDVYKRQDVDRVIVNSKNTYETILEYLKKIDKEKRAIKELLLYLRSPQEMNKFIEHMDQIESLPFDIALIQEYVADLCNKTVSVDLIDEVDFMYEEFVEDKREREEMVSLIGDKGVMFDWEEEEW